jgi:hypothetical protein
MDMIDIVLKRKDLNKYHLVRVVFAVLLSKVKFRLRRRRRSTDFNVTTNHTTSNPPVHPSNFLDCFVFPDAVSENQSRLPPCLPPNAKPRHHLSPTRPLLFPRNSLPLQRWLLRTPVMRISLITTMRKPVTWTTMMAILLLMKVRSCMWRY